MLIHNFRAGLIKTPRPNCISFAMYVHRTHTLTWCCGLFAIEFSLVWNATIHKKIPRTNWKCKATHSAQYFYFMVSFLPLLSFYEANIGIVISHLSISIDIFTIIPAQANVRRPTQNEFISISLCQMFNRIYLHFTN